MIVLRLLLTMLGEMIPRFPQGPFTIGSGPDQRAVLDPPYPDTPPAGGLFPLSASIPLVESGAGAVGVEVAASHGDHVHPASAVLSPGLVGDIVAETINASASAGAVGKYADAGHRHAMPNNGAPVASAPGDVQVTGAAATFANSAHVHAREAFAAPTIALSTAAAAGAAATLIRSDATIAAFDATVPVTQAFSDVAATGAAAFAARRDHKHGMPASPGGLSISQEVAYPTGASTADNEIFTDTANWTSVGANAFDTFAAASGILTCTTKNASKTCRIRNAAITSKAGAFDFVLSMIPELYGWGADLDTTFEFYIKNSTVGAVIAGFLVEARLVSNTLPTYRLSGRGAANAALGGTPNVNIARGLPIWLRIQRDGGNNLTFGYASGNLPSAFTPLVDSNNVPVTGVSATTAEWEELEIITPAGPGATSEATFKADFVLNR